MNIKTIILIMTTVTVLTMAQYVSACTDTGRNCVYSYECCSGACSAAFGFCLPR
ncbi:ctl [Cyclophragma undans nucleopolyhedrovirus]|uniref:Ctl n=1 Tax=Cyclophragma undans nucleopolyhedrovirus TaxID=1906244 RepID=A0A288QPX1_9ABAC|nr:ctl [Cyclophragma undans nucleopolyhedrovirus]AOT85577.1 ctl [Cyclophragma undans nucleopolyhedrovirus]